MHFFTEPTSIQQTVADSYGPIQGNESTMYNVSSVITTTSNAKLFACQDAMMIVQPSTSSNLVNIILKPISGLEIPFNKVQYYIYRGVDISSFLSGSIIVSDVPASRTQFITKFWKNWGDFKTNTNQPNLLDPEPKSFGYDTAISGATNVEELFNSVESTNALINDFQAIRVKEGEWIGNTVASTEFCFEIIMDTDHLTND